MPRACGGRDRGHTESTRGFPTRPSPALFLKAIHAEGKTVHAADANAGVQEIMVVIGLMDWAFSLIAILVSVTIAVDVCPHSLALVFSRFSQPDVPCIQRATLDHHPVGTTLAMLSVLVCIAGWSSRDGSHGTAKSQRGAAKLVLVTTFFLLHNF